jgi:hypothetical protein
MSLRKFALALLFSAFAGSAAFADEASPPIRKNALGVDTAGFFYNQYVMSYERLVLEHLSLCASAGGSPEAEFLTPTFRYLYFQAEARGYPLSSSLSGLYTGFGVSMYFSDTLLDFSRWGIDRDSKGSTAIATLGEIGWKFIFPINDSLSFFIDPNVYIYTIHPLAFSTASTTEEKPFVYKPFSAMCAISVGLAF